MMIRLLEKFVRSGKNTLAETIIVCAAAALSGTFYFYEYYYESWIQIHSVMCLLITAAIAVIWLISAALNGKEGKLGFLIFAFLYWSVPYIYIIYYASRDNLKNYSIWLALFDKAAKALLYNPFYELAGRLGTTSAVLAAILLILVMLTYIGGVLAAHYYRSRMERSELLADEYEGEYVLDDDEYEDNEDD